MKTAVIGLFHKEYFYINFWQNYYGKLFGLENLYVIGELEIDTSFKLFDSKINKINYKPQYFADHEEHTQLVISLQNQLLKNYDTVIFAEADQYFVPDPELYLNLNDYLFRNTQDYIRVSGWNVRQNLLEEVAYDPCKRIMQQRKYWFKDPWPEDKQTIIRKPIEYYSPGFHQCIPTVQRDPNLYNIHLQKFDFSICNSRFSNYTQRENRHPSSGMNGLGNHIWKQDEVLRQDWLEESKKLPIELIPDRFKNLSFI
jgi:hypothetical protein